MRNEAALSRKIMQNLKNHGLLARAMEYRGRNGAPDIVVIGNPTIFIELKHPNGKGKLSAHQAREHERIRNHDGIVYTINSVEQLEAIIQRHYPGAAENDRRDLRG